MTEKPKTQSDQLQHAQMGLTTDQLKAALRGMMQARAVDDRLWLLSRQGKAHFVITSAGHEGTQFGCRWAINVGHDYVVPYYRDMALVMAMGQTPLDIFNHALGKPGDPASGGRQMFGHFSSRALRIVSGSSSVGSHPVHAVGLAVAFRARQETDIAVMTLFGEGATSEGAWHEAISYAGIHQLPVVFVCENNQYAISVHQSKENPVKDIALKAEGYGMPGVIVDGNDIFAVYEAAKAAMDRARADDGPTLLEAKTYRLRPHSNADNDSVYRTEEEVNEWRERDPIKRLREYMLEHDLITEADITAYQQEIEQEVNEATRQAEQNPSPPLESLYDHLYG